MNPISVLHASWLAGALLISGSSAVTAAAQSVATQSVAAQSGAPQSVLTTPATPDQAKSLLQALSLVLGQMLVPSSDPPPDVTRDGDRFHVHIPLPALTTPADAAVEVAATQLGSGAWNISGLTFPSVSTLVMPGASLLSLRLSIGQQEAHARVDPTLALPSTYAAAFSDIGLHIDSMVPADVTIGQATFEGTMTGDGGLRMTTRSLSRADNWVLAGTGQTAGGIRMSLKSAEMRSDIEGLDRVRAERLRNAVRAMSAAPRDPDQPPSPEALDTIIDAMPDLLRAFEVEESFQGLHVQTDSGNSGDLGDMRLGLAATADDNRAAGHFDLGMDDMTLAAIPAQYVPRRVAIKTVFAGIPTEGLRRWLRAAADGSDWTDMGPRALALLNEPGAHAGIDTILIETGPMVVQGSIRVRPLPDGTAGFDAHLTARGVDAMLALVQSDPNAQQLMPALFLAKGMGKPVGDSLMWDIEFAHGVFTVNGLPLGQRPTGAVPHASPAVRPPVKR